MTDGDIRGQYLWYELMTSDPAGAKAFYTKVAGWGIQEWEGGPTPYAMWTHNGGMIGGVMQLPAEARAAGAPSHWLGYVGTPDVDATTTQATHLGASVFVPPTDIPSVGRFAVLADPQGAVFALFTPGPQAPATGGGSKAGEISWHELITTDQAVAFSFYAALFGWEKTTSMDMGQMGIYQIFGRGGTSLGGMFNKPADMPAPPHWLYYIHVEAVDAAVATATANGGTLLNGPMEVPGGDWIAQCLDPQGAAFAVHGKKR